MKAVSGMKRISYFSDNEKNILGHHKELRILILCETILTAIPML